MSGGFNGGGYNSALAAVSDKIISNYDITPAIVATAITLGNLIAPKTVISLFTPQDSGFCEVKELIITETGTPEKAALQILLLDAFEAEPAADAAVAFAGNDTINNVRAIIDVAASDYEDIGGASMAVIKPAVLFKSAASSTNAIMLITAPGGATYGSNVLKMEFRLKEVK